MKSQQAKGSCEKRPDGSGAQWLMKGMKVEEYDG